MADSPTVTPEALAQAALLVNADTDGSKRRSNAAPYLRSFVDSGELFRICDMELFDSFTKKEMIQNFKNAAKVTNHNVKEDRPEYDIPGAYHVQYSISDGELYIINTPLVEAAMAEQAKAVKAAEAKAPQGAQE